MFGPTTTLDLVFLITPAALLLIGMLFAAGVEIYEEYFSGGGWR